MTTRNIKFHDVDKDFDEKKFSDLFSVYCCSRRVGNLAERKYQLAAQKRSEAAVKFDYYNQTAKYFERECGKAKQFNNWKVDNLKSKHLDNIRKTEALESRRNRLRELLVTEEKRFKRQIDEIEAKKKSPRAEVSLEALKKQLIEKRSERSLYTPTINRRIQSYFCYPTTVTPRTPLKELNHTRANNSPRMSLENTNLRDGTYSSQGSAVSSKSAVDYSHVREDFDERALAAKENRSNALTSNFGNDYNPNDIHYNSVSSRPLSKKHHSNITYGNQTMLRDDTNFNTANEKFAKRYERMSLENTNFSEEATDGISTSSENADEAAVEDENGEFGDEHTHEVNKDDPNDSKNYQDFSRAYDDDVDNDVAGKFGSISIQHDKKQEDDGTPGWKSFEHNFPTGRLTYNDKSRTELIFLYLTHNDLKRKIAELEMKEQRATTKGRWDDALRLRDMRNRLELMREREIYQRDDLNIDPATRQAVVDNIEKRRHTLEAREKSCTDSEMYSEDAKLMWKQWMKEDDEPFIADAINQRELLLQQLEEEWRAMAEDDKQRLTHTYNDVMTGSSLQQELKLITEKAAL